MPNFTIEEIADELINVDKIRNFTVAAQVDAGKSTLSDSILSYAGLINQDEAGEKRQTDTMQQEKDRGITIKSVGVSMLLPHDDKKYVINLIDSPGHIDFSSEVSAAIRCTDGVIVLIDTVDGVMAQTKTVLIQSLEERVKPVLVINKIDKLFLSLKMTPDEMYNQFVKNVTDVNGVISEYQDANLVKLTREQTVDPIRGDVVFAAAYHTWGFSLRTFAKFYQKKMPNSTIEKIMKNLWTQKNFISMIIEPIYTVLNACQIHPSNLPDGKNLESIIEKLEINLKKNDYYELRGKDLIRKVMNAWLPVAPAIIELAVDHLPSPKVAQAYRAELLYKGPHTEDDIYFKSLKNCDPNGPLIIYISKMVPTKDNSHFYAFGRVFSGTVKSSKIKVLMNEHDPSNHETHKHKTYLNDSIQRVVLMMATRIERLESVPAGNIMALDGVDKTMIKSGTIVDDNSINCYPLKNMAFSVSPIVRYALTPKNMGELPKFTETLRKFVKSDPCLQYVFTEEGQHLLCGAGELHLEVAIEQLRTDFLKNIEFSVSDPIVPYCETVITESTQMCLAKSPNKHNRLFCKAQPLEKELVIDMIDGTLPKDVKERAKFLVENYNFDDNDARKIWSISPEIEPCNMLVDCTKGLQYLNEIKDSVNAAFSGGCYRGPLCEEPLRGVRLDIHDVTLHADAIHRGGGQIIPATRNVLYASILSASPRIQEPIFKAEIQVPREKVSSIYNLLSKRRGTVNNVIDSSSNMVIAECDLPVADSFGFVEDLRGATSGTAFASLAFSHWQLVPGDPYDPNSQAYKVVMEVRKRKGLKDSLPNFNDYNDKL